MSLPSTSSGSCSQTEKLAPENVSQSSLLGMLVSRIVLPEWVSTNLRKPKSWKMLLRCWIASWVAFIILLPDKSVETLGNAAFFSLLASMMVPPNMPIQIFLFSLLMIVFGVCLGWAFGAAGMRAALAARNLVLVEQQIEKEAQSAAGLADPDALFEASVFAGDFLQTGPTVVFGVFLGIASFLFALIRAYAPRLTIMSIFGTIAADIFCSYGPLFPITEYTLLNSLLTSLACYIAIGIVVIIFVFPETLNHSALTTASGLLAQMSGMVAMQDTVLTSPATELDQDGPISAKVTGARAGLVATLRGFTQQLTFINLEFTWGKWNGDDIRALERPLSTVVGRLSALQGFAKLLGKLLNDSGSASRASTTTKVGSADVAAESGIGDAEMLNELTCRQHAQNSGVPLAELIPVLREATAELRQSCAEAITACKAVVDSVSGKRYVRGSAADLETHLASLDAVQERLERATTSFKEQERLAILEPFQATLDAARDQERRKHIGRAPFRSLYVCYVFTSMLVSLSQGVKGLTETVEETARRRRKNRLWAPKGLRAIGHIFGREDAPADQAIGEDSLPSDEDRPQEREDKQYRLDPDGKPPSNILQRLMNTLHKVLLWAQTAEATFAFKYVFLTIALWVPQVVKTSAHFVYAEKGLWALIMAQTTLNIYAADQIYNLVIRLVGTFIGLILGLLCWYIGSGSGNGNPYGIATIVGVFLIPLVFLRNFAPVKFLPGILLGCTTWALVVGYSWLDGHITMVGNVGIGWSVAWRRWVLVVIGATAGFIMMILPPKSARKAVRLRCASTIASLSYLYAHLMSAWISDAEFAMGEKDAAYAQTFNNSQWVADFREQFVKVLEQIQALQTQAGIAKLEGNIRGAWPSKEYNRLVAVELEMTGNLALLAGSLVQLERGVRVGLLEHTLVVNPNFISDVMSTFMLVSQALRTSEPLHETQYQNLIERVFYHQEANLPATGKEENRVEDFRAKHLQSVANYEYMFYASAIVAVFQLLGNLNEARALTAQLCGEVPLQGFRQWREKYERNINIHGLS